MKSNSDDVIEKIRATFLTLLASKPYKQITFKEIAAESGMTRQNLYYYYKSKENVLEDIIEEFFSLMYEEMVNFDLSKLGESSQDELGKALLMAIVNALKEHEDIARRLFARDVNIIFINKMVAFFNRILGSLIRAQNLTVNDPKYIHYLALQMAGSSFLPMREWLLVDRDFPAERIVELAQPMTKQIIQALKDN